MKTVVLPDGYHGSTIECNVEPLVVDGDLVKLGVTDKPWLIRWIHKDDLAKAMADQLPDETSNSHEEYRHISKMWSATLGAKVTE